MDRIRTMAERVRFSSSRPVTRTWSGVALQGSHPSRWWSGSAQARSAHAGNRTPLFHAVPRKGAAVGIHVFATILTNARVGLTGNRPGWGPAHEVERGRLQRRLKARYLEQQPGDFWVRFEARIVQGRVERHRGGRGVDEAALEHALHHCHVPGGPRQRLWMRRARSLCELTTGIPTTGRGAGQRTDSARQSAGAERRRHRWHWG